MMSEADTTFDAHELDIPDFVFECERFLELDAQA